MSKLIVEMEMPRFCAECPMCDNVYYGDDVRKSFCLVFEERKEILTEDRPSWCPIVGVLPEQHGDLVDADTVLWEEEVPDSEGIVVPVTIGDVIAGYGVPIVIPAERKDDEQADC